MQDILIVLVIYYLIEWISRKLFGSKADLQKEIHRGELLKKQQEVLNQKFKVLELKEEIRKLKNPSKWTIQYEKDEDMHNELLIESLAIKHRSDKANKNAIKN